MATNIATYTSKFNYFDVANHDFRPAERGISELQSSDWLMRKCKPVTFLPYPPGCFTMDSLSRILWMWFPFYRFFVIAIYDYHLWVNQSTKTKIVFTLGYITLWSETDDDSSMRCLPCYIFFRLYSPHTKSLGYCYMFLRRCLQATFLSKEMAGIDTAGLPYRVICVAKYSHCWNVVSNHTIGNVLYNSSYVVVQHSPFMGTFNYISISYRKI